eukprot:CAMPEP_0202979196 /NCGR_PEP_ID=MMETSP1396-20130829/85421_1 /ASSEMBLY_ACC=CAM_ASM_000872 /TAXON_ID= /ORGANISM="Pseudokeronopsis sp., Strain Brazil" /LENGTH=65 /DNA_ID=CAMNT_0049718531 /DNA_START=1430 /DNA_END=1624 /DNA_ORIENTATION=-
MLPIQDLEMKFYGRVAGQGGPPADLMPPVKFMAVTPRENMMAVFLEKGETFFFDCNVTKLKHGLQ